MGVAIAAAVEDDDAAMSPDVWPGDGNGFENKWSAGEDMLA